MTTVDPEIEPSWKKVMNEDFNKEYFTTLKNFLVAERSEFSVYPPGSLIFEAFNRTPFDKVKVVILGQDPYHGHKQAHGLSFSVQDGVKIPPSLKNIYKEINTDLGLTIPHSGDLRKWADQGVLLLNAVLTVRANNAGSHQKKGWEQFTDSVINSLSESDNSKVFMLWGNFAKSKRSLITNKEHLILEAPHPSPFSAHTGFLGCKHFSKANQHLLSKGLTEIDWSI